MAKEGVNSVLFVAICNLLEYNGSKDEVYVNISSLYGGSVKLVKDEEVGVYVKIVTLYRRQSALPVHEIILKQPIIEGSGHVTAISRMYSRGVVNLTTAVSITTNELGIDDIKSMVKVVRNKDQKWALVKLLNMVL
jgi:hypothetical protein